MWPPDAAAVRAAARSVGVRLDDAQAGQLMRYLGLLARWNATYNLTAVRDPAAMWSLHVLDCLAAVPSVRRHLPAGAPGRVLDVGSGGGLPGIVWAIAMPDLQVTCVDAVAKKVAFIRQAVGGLGLASVRAWHGRVEALHAPPFDLIASRALGSLAELTRLTGRLLSPSGCWVAMKGKVPNDELAVLDGSAHLFHVEPLQVPGLDAERCLVWLTHPPESTPPQSPGG